MSTAKPIPRSATIGGGVVTLAPPKSYTARLDVVLASARNPHRGAAAALGLCWQSVGRPKAVYAYEPLPYGGAVLDELTERGVKMVEIVAAGTIALALCSDGLISEDEVTTAAGNSEAGDDPAR
jgi:hypothetical protein